MFADGDGQSRVRRAAIQIRPGFDGVGVSLFGAGGKMMPTLDIGNRIAIGDHVPVESPILAQMLLKQHGVGARRRPVDGVVGAHDRIRVTVHDGGAERGEIRVLEIVI